MKSLITSIIIVISLLLVALTARADYYGEGFPVGGPLHYGQYRQPQMIRYKKVPPQYRGDYGAGYGDYYNGYRPGVFGIQLGFSVGYHHGGARGFLG